MSDPIQRFRVLTAQLRDIIAKMYASVGYRAGENTMSDGVHYSIGTFSLYPTSDGITARLDIGQGGDTSSTHHFYELFHSNSRDIDTWWKANTLEELVGKVEHTIKPVIESFDQRKAQIEMREEQIRRLNWEIKQLVGGRDVT